MKRLLAIILSIIIIISMSLSLGGCSEVSVDDALTMGQWLTLVADSFGMENYVQSEPYFKNVTKNSEYFSVFQASAEWNVVEPSDDITISTPLTWKDVLISLVNAGEFVDENATDDEKFEYAVNNFDGNIRTYWENRYIKLKQAVPLLDNAQEKWSNMTFDQKIEESKFSEDVSNLLESDVDYSSDGNKITMSASQAEGLKAGDVYTLPRNDTDSSSINKIKSIKFVDGKAIITNDENFSEEEAGKNIEKITIQETSSLDFGNIVGIYDANGNLLTSSDTDGVSFSAEETDEIVATPLVATDTNYSPYLQQLGIFDKAKGSFSLKIGDYKGTLTVSKSSLGVEISKELKSASSKNRYKSKKTSVYVKTSFNDVLLTKDIDYSWGKLRSAIVKLDYKTNIEGGIKCEKSGKVGKATKEGEGVTQKLSTVIKEYKSALSDLKKDVKSSKCDDEIYICKLVIADCGLADLEFVVKGKVSASGELKIVFEIQGAQGIQYKNGNLRYIKSKSVDCDFIADAKLEVTIGPGLNINILKKIFAVGFELNAGLGASVTFATHLVDAEMHQLYTGSATISATDADDMIKDTSMTTAEDIKEFAESQGGSWDAYVEGNSVTISKKVCLDWKLYPILNLGIDPKCILGKIADKLDFKVSVEFLGSDNAFLKGHIDFPNNITAALASDSVGSGLSELLGVNKDCTYDFKPWDNANETLEEVEEEIGATESEDILKVTKTIELSDIRVFLEKDQCAKITVVGLPKGYELKDVVAVSEDDKIASFDLIHGVITAKKSGITQIEVKTKDGKHKVYCAVTVMNDEKITVGKVGTKKA